MVPGVPGKPEEPGPNPQSCDTGCSLSRDWDHQGCLGHFSGRSGRSVSGTGGPGRYCGPSSDGIY